MDIDLMLRKANVFIEALPQIKDNSNKVVVIKYGGSAMIDEELKKNVVEDLALLKIAGFKPIVVHGGGKEINKWVDRLGIKNTFVNGLRVTDEQTMEIAEMVLSKLNKELVQIMESNGVKAVGISGKDGGTIKVNKRFVNDLDIGLVGKIKKVDTSLLNTLLDNDFTPIISPIGLDDQFQEYNINADDVACAVATAVKAEKLVFLTDIEGVCRDPKDSSTLISELTVPEAKEFLDSGNAGGGMLPKLINCIDAVENGVSRVHILDGRIQHSLLLEFFTNKGIGTIILNSEKGANQ
ncbi:MAG: acetylglutamate kinase [Sedimentibacter sp.]